MICTFYNDILSFYLKFDSLDNFKTRLAIMISVICLPHLLDNLPLDE